MATSLSHPLVRFRVGLMGAAVATTGQLAVVVHIVTDGISVPFVMFFVGSLICFLICIRVALLGRVRLKDPTWCRNCEYNLLHNESGKCPECGQRIPVNQRRDLRRSPDAGPN